MICSRRLYKGNSYEICLPLKYSGVTGVNIYTDGAVKIPVTPEISGDTLCFEITSEDLDVLADGVLRYELITDSEVSDSNSRFVVKTPEGYSAQTLDNLLEEAYQSGYTAGGEECSGGTDLDLIANLQGDYYVIPCGTTKLRNYALQNIPASSITIPNTVIEIGNGAFYSSSLEEVTMADSVTEMGQTVFQYNRSLRAVTLSNSLSAIPSSTFWGCSSLSSITIPASVTSIGSTAFRQSGLKEITIPSGVTELGGSIFLECGSLESVTILCAPSGLPDKFLEWCAALTSFTIPDTVTTLGNNCFAKCYSLTGITIPTGVTSLGNYCFSGCTSFSSLTIPASVTTIGQGAFCIPTLPELTFEGLTPPTLVSKHNADNFKGTYPIYVPCEAVDAYKTAWAGIGIDSRITCREENP